MTKILLGIPTQEIARAAVFYDYLELLEKPDGVEMATARAHGQSPAKNRNLIIQQAIDGGMDYIFFVDDDCILPPDTLKKLYARNVDCVTGLYSMRNYPHRPIIFDVAMDNGACAWHDLDDNETGLVEVVATGMGALLTKIDVFKKIQVTERYWVTLGELESDHWCDDLSFFKRVRKAGIKIHCDLNAPVGHVSKATIWPNRINDKWHITYDTEGPQRISFPMPSSLQNRAPVQNTKMKAPGELRDTTYMRGVMQINITNVCNLTCTNCTQGCQLKTHPQSMSLEQFEQAVISVKDYYGVIGIYGGNPVMHHQFRDICNILKQHIPFEQRGIWTNNLLGKGDICRDTFNPVYSNLNVHGEIEAYNEFARDWPRAMFNVKGMEHSRHSPPYVAIQDMEDLSPDEKRAIILTCDINKYWSAMIGLFRGEIRAYFCELACAQARLHEDDSDYPDTGLPVIQNWWKLPIENFQHQVDKHCYECGIPLRGYGDLDNGVMEYVSKTHLPIYKTKGSGKMIKLVTKTSELEGHVKRATDYVENGQMAGAVV